MRTRNFKNKLAALMIMAISASVIAPAFAGAQTVDPTSSQYGNPLQQVSQGGSACTEDNSGSAAGTGAGSGSNCAPPPSNDAGLGGNVGPLPFTGFDVIAMAAVALAVTGLGLALQRAVSRDPGDHAV